MPAAIVPSGPDRRAMTETRATATDIDALLPQTQCERCGYGGCLPYAEALARREAPVNQCPPGGQALVDRLAALLAVPLLPLDARHAGVLAGRVARIDPQACIGCARCLPPCPVDAILGAQRTLHSVIADWCTGCELCLPACPVDCIQMEPRTALQPEPLADASRLRHRAHQARAAERAAGRAAEVQALKAVAGEGA
jgi:electron transport complex protein RnfB